VAWEASNAAVMLFPGWRIRAAAMPRWDVRE